MKKVSICIPAYKRPDVLKRSLDSILKQDFTDFEIIITDDSPDDSVENLVNSYPPGIINYYRNPNTLGSPENWNESIRKAQGEYIKILHHDDWFASSDSLGKFVNMLDENPAVDIAFSASCDIHPSHKKTHILNDRVRSLIENEPEFLYKGNQIGAPDVCIFRNNKDYFFDSSLVWLVDIDFYIQILKQNPLFIYTKEVLIYIGISELQVTNQCLADSALQIQESIYLYKKLNLENKNTTYKRSLMRLLGRSHIFNSKELNDLLPDENMELSMTDSFWARYFYLKKQGRTLLQKVFRRS